ncbi:hypothetical protein ABXK61_29255 [Burkholderia sola]|uniref:hypothetical protein n=1 Tax=Burkholderia TaxID=32008 RepID=UPI001FD7680F|nr:hypothetical protein [Burkholderia sp. AcTa6-5]
MKPITANAQFNALLPLTIVIVLRSRITPDRGSFGTAGRRTGMRAPCGRALVRKARGNVAIGVFAGMYHSAHAPISGVGAVSRRAPSGVAIRLFARSCFLLTHAVVAFV